MTEQFATEALNTPAVTADRLKQHIDALRKLKADQKELSDAISFRYAMAKGEGFDKDTLRVLVKRLDSDRAELSEADSLLQLYESWYHGDVAPELVDAMFEVSRAAGREKRNAA